MNRDKWTLLALALAHERGLSPVQLQKSLFLLGKNLNNEVLGSDYYQFEPYNYGPFDVAVYQDAEHLSRQGFVTITRTAERRWPLYQITEAGASAARQIQTQVASEVMQYLERVVAWTQRLSFRQLVKAIYARYPEMRERSVFQG